MGEKFNEDPGLSMASVPMFRDYKGSVSLLGMLAADLKGRLKSSLRHAINEPKVETEDYKGLDEMSNNRERPSPTTPTVRRPYNCCQWLHTASPSLSEGDRDRQPRGFIDP